ncbi:isopenicillin N-epimerase [Actinokineospora spheciospongiae]|uniref:Isopenicillin N-epimerase n=1 Tax=Actinokineospora spheciospongiae TaxID=909613 RepID=W7J0F6_9PSEU|nr:isopenicillin N-epimerase [Actinokineospora spheciospongiae]
MGRVTFSLDPAVHHLNPGGFGIVPVEVREAQARFRAASDANPMRFHRVDTPALVAAAREAASGFLGADVVLVRNATEAAATVLASLPLAEGDEILLSDHGYGAVAIAAQAAADRVGARLRVVHFPADAGPDEVVAAFAGGLTAATRLVVVDAITSPTALVLPVAGVAQACRERGVPVFVDAAHAPGHLDQRPDLLGVDFWAGNLHKWAYAPRTSAGLWIAPPWRDRVRPLVPSWDHPAGYPRWFDHAGTGDYSGWMALPAAFDHWRAVGGWDAVAASSALLDRGVRLVADALGAPGQVSAHHAPLMRLVALPSGLVADFDDAARYYGELSARGIEVPVIHWHGAAYVRVGATTHTTEDDFAALAAALAEGR